MPNSSPISRPPVEDAGLYSELAALKDSIAAYRQATDENERRRLYAEIEDKAKTLHFLAEGAEERMRAV